jgi:hypothetical protein
MVLGIHTPRTRYPDGDRGPVARRLDNVRQTSLIGQEGEAFHARRAQTAVVTSVRESLQYSASAMPTAPQQACNVGNHHCSASSAKLRTMARCANAEWTPDHWQNHTTTAPVKGVF